jgi:hypothetical protein
MLPQPATSSPLWFIICWLAVWRITMLLCYEAGPFDVFAWIRVGFVRVGLHRLIRCPHCVSFWVSIAVVLSVYELHARSIMLVLGIAGAASLTERFLGTGLNEDEENDD